MKYIKTFENNNDDNDIYYAYVDITLLEDFLKVVKEYNIKYALYLLKSSDVAIFTILKLTDELIRNTKINSVIHIEKNKNVAENIKNKCENITNLSISKIKDIFDIYEQTKKYNL